MATGDAKDILARLNSVLPGWFPQIAPVRDSVLSGFAQIGSWAYALLVYTKLQTRVSTATDGFLDIAAWDFFGSRIRRKPGQLDGSFRNLIKAEVLRERGTRRGMVRALKDLTGSLPVIFEPGYAFDTGGFDTYSLGFDAGGGWGSNDLPYQMFIRAVQPIGAGVPNAAGWGDIVGPTTTNFVYNNTMANAVAGTPGVLPTQWALNISNGLSCSIAFVGNENGTPCFDVRIFGTTTNANPITLTFSGLTGAPTINGQVWTLSAFFKIAAGSWTNVTGIQLYHEYYTSVSGYAGGNYPNLVALPTGQLQRVSTTATVNQITAAYILPGMNFAIASGVAVDFTLRIGSPQLERGAVMNAVISTVSGSQGAAIGGYFGGNFGAWDGGYSTLIDANAIIGKVTDQDIYEMVEATRPSGIVCWVTIGPPLPPPRMLGVDYVLGTDHLPSSSMLAGIKVAPEPN